MQTTTIRELEWLHQYQTKRTLKQTKVTVDIEGKYKSQNYKNLSSKHKSKSS